MNYEQAARESIKELFEENQVEDLSTEEVTGEEMPQPVDNYQKRVAARKVLSTPKAHGASPKLMLNVSQVIERLAPEFRRAKSNSEYWMSHGDRQRSQLISEQYMEDYFHPAVEALVQLNSAEELATSPKATGKLDEYALIPGGRANGYTSAFVQGIYDLSGTADYSDNGVREAVRKIIGLVDQDQIRAAVGVATQIKNKIDAGENKANEEDYDLIQRVIIRSGK